MKQNTWHEAAITPENSELAMLIDEALYGALSEVFDSEKYTQDYPDIRDSELSAFEHFLNYGYFEGRIFKTLEGDSTADFYHLVEGILNQYLAAKKNVTLEDYLYQKGVLSSIFNPSFYLKKYGLKLPEPLAIDHYLLVGKPREYQVNDYFIPSEYTSMYEDIGKSDIDATYHYAAQGLSEGRIPRILDTIEKYGKLPEAAICSLTQHFFDETFYLDTYQDIAESNLTPIKHYAELGWREMRQPCDNLTFDMSEMAFNVFLEKNVNPTLIAQITEKTGIALSNNDELSLLTPDSSTKSQQSSHHQEQASLEFEIDMVTPYVDPDFYFSMYPEAATSGLSAAQHYCHYGWKEGKDPSANFSTSFYLEDNVDVKGAGVIPLFHYAVAGKNERRYCRRPGGLKSEAIYHIEPLEVTKKHWQLPSAPTLIEPQNIVNKLPAETEGLVISISHDVYLERTGGVQICIVKEQQKFNANGYTYAHIAPYQPLPSLADDNIDNTPTPYFELSINGEYLGTCTVQALFDIVRNQTSTVLFALHALQGHSDEAISDLIRSAQKREVLVWLHDYFTLCEGYNLLRNTVTFCGGPNVESKACSVCVFGQQRQKHLLRVKNILSVEKFTMIAPSQTAKNVWLDAVKRTTLPLPEEIIVQEHIVLEKHKKVKVENTDDKIRIAFVGYPSLHKGWQEFSEFVRFTTSSERYEYFHIGAAPPKDVENVNFVECIATAVNPDAMPKALSNNDIDYVYIPATWPETFNLVCYESIAAGAKIITHPSSGNVNDFISKNKHGVVVESDAVLRQDHESILKKPKSKKTFKMIYSDMSFGIKGLK